MYRFSQIKQIKKSCFGFCFLVCLLVILFLNKCPSGIIEYSTMSSLFGTQHPSNQPLVKSSNLPLRTMSLFQDVYLDILISLCPDSFLFGAQQRVSRPPVKKSTLPFRKLPVFQGVAPWHTNFTLSCIIPLWNPETTHSPSEKEFNLSSQEDVCFSRPCTLAYRFHLILYHPSLGLSSCSPILR